MTMKVTKDLWVGGTFYKKGSTPTESDQIHINNANPDFLEESAKKGKDE